MFHFGILPSGTFSGAGTLGTLVFRTPSFGKGKGLGGKGNKHVNEVAALNVTCNMNTTHYEACQGAKIT